MLEPEALRRTEKRCHPEPKDRDPQKISKPPQRDLVVTSPEQNAFVVS